MGAEMPGQLYGRRADRARGSVDQNAFAGLNIGEVAQEVERRRAAERYRSGFPVGETARYQRNRAILRHGLQLGVTSHANAAEGEHLVARSIALHFRADGFDDTGEFRTEDRRSRPGQAEKQPAQ